MPRKPSRRITEPRLSIGCCGWTEAQSRYVQDFRTIELQTTFYQMPTADVARRWKALAPPDFRFCMKAWQLITHTPASPTYRRLKSKISSEETDLYGSFRPTEQVSLAWERTREIAQILEAQVIVFQCPKSFLPTRGNVRNLGTFFQEVDRCECTFAWEPRGVDWSQELVRDLCADNYLVHCVDPFESESAYGDALYWRLHGKEGYRYRYTEEDLADLDAKLDRYEDVKRERYVMFNNIYSKQDALRFIGRDQTPQ
ncbi:MAG: DUF72 domain-containing protein [Bryobacteraceae bacterium]